MEQNLIDANKLEVDYIKASTTTNRWHGYISKEQVENAPTVDAIPIEWLTQRIEELEAELHSLYLRFSFEKDSKEKGEALLRCVELRTPLTAYETVLSEWRKENEVQRSED